MTLPFVFPAPPLFLKQKDALSTTEESSVVQALLFLRLLFITFLSVFKLFPPDNTIQNKLISL